MLRERRDFLKKDWFTIGHVAKCCDVSRSTLLRMEDKGLLTPVYSDEGSGYRYYDNNNVAKILHVKAFLEMGLSYDDIIQYFNSAGSSIALVEKLEQQLFILKRAYQEMKLRLEDKNHMTAEIINLPEYTCYAREYTGSNTDDQYRDMYNLFHEVIEKGCKPLATEPLFVISQRYDFINGRCRDTNFNYTCCVPLEPTTAPEDAVKIPGGKALSVLYYGEYGGISNAHLFLGEKVRELGLTPSGFIRVFGLVAPYTGEGYNPDKYISRLVLPVEG